MNLIGQPFDRTDGLLKVTGEARYAAEFPEARLAHAVLVTSTIARGTIASIDASRAQAVPGVLLVMTHENAPRLPNGGKAQLAPPAGRRLSLLQDNEVHYNNEPVAVVVADTLEHATDAARQLRITYRARPRSTLRRRRPTRMRPTNRRDVKRIRSAAVSTTACEAPPCISTRPTRRRSSITIRWSRTRRWRVGTARNSRSTIRRKA